MKKIKLFILNIIIPFSVLFGDYRVPALEKPIEDPSTGLQVPPGFKVDLIYEVDKKKFG